MTRLRFYRIEEAGEEVEGDCVKTESATLQETLPLSQELAKNEEHFSPVENSVLETSISSPTAVTDGECLSPPVFIEGKVIVYAALSGLVSFLPDGNVHGCNHHFALMLFGYSQQELLKKVWPCALLRNWVKLFYLTLFIFLHAHVHILCLSPSLFLLLSVLLFVCFHISICLSLSLSLSTSLFLSLHLSVCLSPSR